MITSAILVGVTRVLVGAHARWIGCAPSPVQRIYFANHSSHLDTLAIWASLPAPLRARTRPVAARDYWGHGGVRGFIADRGFRAVYIERTASRHTGDPLEPLHEALRQADSLIIFPEGTRGASGQPQEFKAGLYHLGVGHPEVELVPVYLDSLHRVMPKGRFIPVPLICTVRFGKPLRVEAGEHRHAFLDRARVSVLELA